MKTIFLCTLGQLLFLATGVSIAQEKHVTMPEPTEKHAWLDKFSGQWKIQSKATMAPGQPAMELSGTLSSRKIGGFWILNEFFLKDGSGSPTTGIQSIGFDGTKDKYIGTWIDSMTSFMWQYEGTVDSTGKVLTLKADGPNFMDGGKLTKFEDIYEFKSDDEMIMTSRMLGADRKWITFMSGTATREK